MLKRNDLFPGTVCEIGCGAGAILEQLQLQLNNNCVFYGYDISPQAIALCLNRANDKLHFKLKDITKESNDDSFDLLLIIDVVEHIEDYFDFLRKIRIKGEYKIFHIPLEINVLRVLRGYPMINSWKNSGHIHNFTKETALQSLVETGYEIVDYFYTCNYKELNIKYWKTCILQMIQRVAFTIHSDLAVRLFGGCSLMVLTK
jgi:hypothetical protein